MVINQIPKASAYLHALYNLYGTPSCYFDGGYQVLVGGTSNQSFYTSRIAAAAAREVPDLDLDVAMAYIDPTHIQYTISVTNNNFVNTAPNGPQIPHGPSTAVTDQEQTFSSAATDPDGDQLYYKWDWGDETSDWMGPYNSGETADADHSWTTAGTYSVAVKVKDQYDVESGWSDPASITLVGRGDSNNDGDINVADAVFLITFIFKDGPSPDPFEAGDANCDDAVNVGDPVYLINYIFKDGPAPGCY
jgi:hypothetical protein